jgi:glucose-1-phosphate thymidylyltransferase
MKCVLLAAGYATRLYPLTKTFPKSLLPVGSRTILDRILDKVDRVEPIDEIIIVTNKLFLLHFHEFGEKYTSRKRMTILSDGSTCNDNRLGAIADLYFAIQELALDDDLLVLAGDNLFDFELSNFVDFFIHVAADCVTTHKIMDVEALKRTGIVELASDGKVIGFEEKPRLPKTQWAVPPFYLYRRETLPLISTYLDTGGNPDAPGNFLPWLIHKRPVYAYKFNGRRYDIGSPESYAEVQEIFRD